MLARAGCRRSCHSGSWGYVIGVQTDLPSIALANMNRRPIAFDFDGAAVRVLNGLAPFPVSPYRITSSSYEAKGIRINRVYMVFGVPSLELVCTPILYCVPTVNRSLRRHNNRVPRVAFGHGGRIVVSVCLVYFLTEYDKLLDYLLIGHHCVLLGKRWRSKADYQPYEGNY